MKPTLSHGVFGRGFICDWYEYEFPWPIFEGGYARIRWR